MHPFKLVASALGCDPQSLSMNSGMYRDHGWDSFGHLCVVLALEKEYGIAIDDAVFESFKQMREIYKCYENIRRKIETND